MTAKGLRVDVYRNVAHANNDATNGGVSSKVGQFTLVGTVPAPAVGRSRGNSVVPIRERGQINEQLSVTDGNVSIFAPTEAAPPAILVYGRGGNPQPNLVPLDVYLSGEHYMFGGNLAAGQDHAWGELIATFYRNAGIDEAQVTQVLSMGRDTTVHIHDRVEEDDQWSH